MIFFLHGEQGKQLIVTDVSEAIEEKRKEVFETIVLKKSAREAKKESY